MTDETRIPDRMFFRIGEVAELVGVEPHVLRYWETEFKIRPPRSDAGQRMYRRRDVAKLLHVKRLLHDEGYTIAGARKALSQPDEPGEVSEAPPVAAPADPGRARDALARIEAARATIRALRALVSKPLDAPDPAERG